MRAEDATCIEDLRLIARRRVPRAFFDYAEAGSYAEETLRANRADLADVKLRQRVLVDVATRSTATSIVREPSRSAASRQHQVVPHTPPTTARAPISAQGW